MWTTASGEVLGPRVSKREVGIGEAGGGALGGGSYLVWGGSSGYSVTDVLSMGVSGSEELSSTLSLFEKRGSCW